MRKELNNSTENEKQVNNYAIVTNQVNEDGTQTEVDRTEIYLVDSDAMMDQVKSLSSENAKALQVRDSLKKTSYKIKVLVAL